MSVRSNATPHDTQAFSSIETYPRAFRHQTFQPPIPRRHSLLPLHVIHIPRIRQAARGEPKQLPLHVGVIPVVVASASSSHRWRDPRRLRLLGGVVHHGRNARHSLFVESGSSSSVYVHSIQSTRSGVHTIAHQNEWDGMACDRISGRYVSVSSATEPPGLDRSRSPAAAQHNGRRASCLLGRHPKQKARALEHSRIACGCGQSIDRSGSSNEIVSLAPIDRIPPHTQRTGGAGAK